MAVKTITVTTKAYEAVKGLKRHDESFSELFTRIGYKRATFDTLRGALKTTPKEAEDWHKRLRAIREEMSKDMEEKIERVRTRLKRTH
ncbi:hypothetical protein J4219_04055 [Candidatus Woesearchaeota archaeon]|nr:hypothetical protein [Candidatus Woesearchaeota archaeon]